VRRPRSGSDGVERFERGAQMRSSLLRVPLPSQPDAARQLDPSVNKGVYRAAAIGRDARLAILTATEDHVSECQRGAELVADMLISHRRQEGPGVPLMPAQPRGIGHVQDDDAPPADLPVVCRIGGIEDPADVLVRLRV
jgi:hypothetical protein